MTTLVTGKDPDKGMDRTPLRLETEVSLTLLSHSPRT